MWLLVYAVLVPAGSAHARAGEIDTGFGRYGSAVLERFLQFPDRTLQPNRLFKEDLAAGSDGSYTAVGTLENVSDSPSFPGGFGMPALARYTPAGFPDPAFGTDGGVVMNLPDASARAVVVDGEQRAVIAGLASRDDEVRVFLARFLRDGRLDATFGNGGVSDFGATFAVRDLVAQPDGKLLVGGDVRQPDGSSALHVARLTPNGALDATFGAGGTAVVSRADSYVFAALAYQPGGGVLAAGQVARPDRAHEVLVMRFTPDGHVDESFGNAGEARPQFSLPGGVAGASPSSLAALGDGRIAVTASVSRYDPSLPREQWAKRPAVARLLPDGSFDPSFGDDGTADTWVGIESDPSDDALALEPNGNLVLAAYGGARAAVIRYRPDGSLDPAFGEGGISRAASGALALVRGPGDKLAVLARAPCGFGLGVARLDGSDEPDVSVRAGLVRLRENRLTVPLRGTRAAQGRLIAYSEQAARRYPGDFGPRCPERTRVASKRFRLQSARRVTLRLDRAEVRRIRRGTPVAFLVASRREGRTGGTTTLWKYERR